MAPERLMAWRTDLFLFESEFIAERFRTSIGAVGGIARINHNGIGPAEFEPVARAADFYDLVMVGELRDLKGVDTLIDAIALLRGRGILPRLLIVGSGPDRLALVDRARDRGVADRITFAAPQPIRRALEQARIMVAPSLAESFPYAILEAAAARQPLIATRVGGVPELFGPHAQALIRPDDPEVLANAIAGKIAEPDCDRLAKAEALAEWVGSRFTIRRMVDGAQAAFEAALDARSASASVSALDPGQRSLHRA
jgi:glycosyltransferase involved in cell wall biosynthesis